MRIAIRDSASGRLGSAGQFIDVPDVAAGRFALSGLLLSAEGAAGRQEKTDILGDTAVRAFHPGQAISFVLQVYNAGAPALEARLLLCRDGKPLLKGEPAPLTPADTSDPKRILATGSLRLGAGMPPGPCLLQIVASDKAKKNAVASQWIDFEVVR